MHLIFQIKLAVRNLLSRKIFSAISILSLSLAFVSVLLITMWVKHELSYDRFIPNHTNVYRLTLEKKTPDGYNAHFARVARDWVMQVGDYIPEIESTLRFSLKRTTLITIGDRRFTTENLFVTDTTVFSMFGLDLVAGDTSTALDNPFCVVLSESAAAKYFPNTLALGQTLSLKGHHDMELKNHLVTGIYKDFPAASHMHPEMLLSFEDPQAYGWSYFYVVLNENTVHEELQEKLKNYIIERANEEEANTLSLHLQPVRDIHLYSDKDREIERNGNMQAVIILSGIALLILLIALFNYINLNIALLFKEVRFLVVNRVYGATSKSIFTFQLLKSALLVFIAILLAVSFSFFANDLPGPGEKDVFNSSQHPWVLLSVLTSLLVVSVIAGSLPSFYFIQRRFNSRAITRSGNLVRLFNPGKRFIFRKILIGFQLAISVILILFTLIAGKQMKYFSSHHMGIEQGEKILITGNMNNEIRAKYPEIRHTLLKSPYIKEVAAIMEVPPSPIKDAFNIETDSPADMEDIIMYVGPVSDNFFTFYQRPIIAGNDFPPYINDQQFESYILNETAVRLLGYEDPAEAIGKDFKVQFFTEGIFYGGKIVGIVEDFHQTSLHHKIAPTVYFQQPLFYINFLVKFKEEDTEKALEYIEATWSEFVPDYPFVYNFQDQLYAAAYSKEHRQSLLTSLFTVLAIIITVIGLLGITTILTEQRTREIGIRTVLGAGSWNLMFTSIQEIVLVLGVAIVLAVPIAMLGAAEWLNNFAYTLLLSNLWWLPVLVSIVSFILTTSIVILMVFATSRRNPVESLKGD